MGVLVIRTTKRYAVRRAITLRSGSPRKCGGLMIELSSEGCRISNAGSALYTVNQPVTVDLEDGEQLPGFVRWAHDGFVGVKFAHALRQNELADLLAASRAPEFRAAVA